MWACMELGGYQHKSNVFVWNEHLLPVWPSFPLLWCFRLSCLCMKCMCEVENKLFNCGVRKVSFHTTVVSGWKQNKTSGGSGITCQRCENMVLIQFILFYVFYLKDSQCTIKINRYFSMSIYSAHIFRICWNPYERYVEKNNTLVVA